MNQTWHNSKHRRHSKVGNTYMAQSTPTHASGFHLVIVAMTGHAEDKGSTTTSHRSLKRCCLKCKKWEQEREHGIVSIWSNGWLLAWWFDARIWFFVRVITVLLGGRTCRKGHRQHNHYQTMCNNMMHVWNMAIWVCWANATKTRRVWTNLNQRFKFQIQIWPFKVHFLVLIKTSI